ncbi:MAG TPA: META domain-containing protein [Mucilaginibacter sp.]
MKKIIIAALISGCLLLACTAKKAITTPDPSKLAGTWELNSITGSSTSFNELYPNKKPTIVFDLVTNKISGYTGCNSFNGPLNVDVNKINFTEAMATTRMFCQGQGENVFMETLKKVNTWSVSNDTTLNLIAGDIAVMRFSKK